MHAAGRGFPSPPNPGNHACLILLSLPQGPDRLHFEMRYLNTFLQEVSSICDRKSGDVLRIQERILRYLYLFGGSTFLVLALYSTARSDWKITINTGGSWAIVGALVIGNLLRSRLSYLVRVFLFLGVVYLASWIGIFTNALLGIAPLGLVFVIVLLGVFINYRAGFLLLSVTTLALVAFCVSLFKHRWIPPERAAAFTYSYEHWGLWIVAIIIACGSFLIIFSVVHGNLEMRVRKLKESKTALAEKHRELEEHAERLKETMEELTKSNRVKDQFLEVIRHELRTPLNPIIGLIADVDESKLDPEERHNLYLATTSAKHLLGMIEQILSFTHLEKDDVILSPQWTRLDSLIEDIRFQSRNYARSKDLRVVIETEPLSGLEFYTDPQLLSQLFSELFSNALKFTQKGGITVSGTVRNISNNPESGVLTFVFEDTGIGIAEKDQENLFKPFTQLDVGKTRKFGGLGLGLSIVSRLARTLEAEIELTSKAGQGTRVSVTMELPQRSLEAGLNADAAELVPPHLHLLVAEDDIFNQRVVGRMLTRIGVTYSIANNGREAVEVCRKSSYDAILMDVSMPEMDGMEATRCIRTLPGFQSTPIIALTAYNTKEVAQMCFDAGMDAFLTKPANSRKLAGVLAKCCGTQSRHRGGPDPVPGRQAGPPTV